MARILVMDDDPNVRRVLEMMLERAGHEVRSASDGYEGMRLFHEHRFDLVITDVIMPRREGLETIAELRRQKRRVPIVAITGYIGKPYLEAAAQLGACEILFKPFERRQLIEAVTRALTTDCGRDLASEV
ncbi:MAG: response regulator [Kiritimatiellaeota bacterium]|nr:response regulator [Kiritimatiellota bacterium]